MALRLRQAREALGVSQRALGMLVGWDASVASPRINQYERGKHSPDVQTLSLLADKLDCPLAFFYAVEDDLAALVLGYHRADASRRKTVIRALSNDA